MSAIFKSVSNVANLVKNPDAFTKKQTLFAVIHMFGQQHIIKTGDLLMVNGYIPVNVGQPIIINKCLILGGKDFSLIGRPMVDNDLFSIEAITIEQTMSDVRCLYRHSPRNHGISKYFYQSLPRTTLRINNIELKKMPDAEEFDMGSEK